MDKLRNLCFILIFAIIFALYDLPWEAYIYACILYAVIYLGTYIFEVWKSCKKKKILHFMQQMEEFEQQQLPKPNNALEREYQVLLKKQQKQLSQLREEFLNEKTEMLDYYTHWVHQIKTPIAALRLILQEEDTAIIREMKSQLFQIEQYVEMVLAYLRLGGENDFVIKSQALEPIVRQAVRKYAPLFIRKRLKLNLGTMPQVNIVTDEKWFCFVLEQVLSNSIKYTNEGEIHISFEENLLIIKDTGIGIAAEDLPRICEKGFTGYNGHADKKASGLGLYLSKKILMRLGHKFQIESKVGEGTTVKISIANPTLIYD